MKSSFLLLAETAILVSIIFFIPYTEIDWIAYMEEVEMCLNGELDYRSISGGTGPLVYPAGFVWLFIALRFVSRGGVDINLMQYIYAAVYLGTLSLALCWYRAAKVPLWSTLFLFCSKRIRSLYVLRLFNDCWAILAAFVAVWLLTSFLPTLPHAHSRISKIRLNRDRRWYLGCLLMSMGISIKMNICLFLPGLLCILLYSLPFSKVVVCGLIGAGWQLFVGIPFFLSYPESYVSKAFELSRVFQHRWSVNYQFLSVDVFEHRCFHTLLFGLMLVSYGFLWKKRWGPRCRRVVEEASVVCVTEMDSSVKSVPNSSSTLDVRKNSDRKEIGKGRKEREGEVESTSPSFPADTPAASPCFERSVTNGAIPKNTASSWHTRCSFEWICLPHVLTLLESNLVGVAFSRSMHYQFFIWIFFSILFVLHYTKLPSIVSMAFFAAIQYGFEVYPPTPFSSAVLMGGFACTVLSTLFLGNEGNNAKVSRTSKSTGDPN